MVSVMPCCPLRLSVLNEAVFVWGGGGICGFQKLLESCFPNVAYKRVCK